MSWWVDQDGRPIGQCARSKLQSLTDHVQWWLVFSVCIGFKVEVILLRLHPEPGPGSIHAANLDHSWCSMTPDDERHLGLLEEVMNRLSAADIMVQLVHAERSLGQWEFVLPPDHRLRAVDRFAIARQAIRSIAGKYGLRAMLHPRPFPEFPGTGAHVHLSLNSTAQDGSQTEPVLSVNLQHFPAVSAFALPHELNYPRVAPGITSGGVDCAWGWDNREPLLGPVGSDGGRLGRATAPDPLNRRTLSGARQQPVGRPTGDSGDSDPDPNISAGGAVSSRAECAHASIPG
ncbi:hypothetical protein BDV09DRAFT_195212 [Aspergillus tetrazonus]